MELGCFLAGSIISAGGDKLSHKVESLISPIKDFLSALFFAAIGKKMEWYKIVHETTTHLCENRTCQYQSYPLYSFEIFSQSSVLAADWLMLKSYEEAT